MLRHRIWSANQVQVSVISLVKAAETYDAFDNHQLIGETEQSLEDQEKAKVMKSEILSHWHQNLTINLVYDHTPWVPGQVPPPLDEFVEFTPSLQQERRSLRSPTLPLP